MEAHAGSEEVGPAQERGFGPGASRLNMYSNM